MNREETADASARGEKRRLEETGSEQEGERWNACSMCGVEFLNRKARAQHETASRRRGNQCAQPWQPNELFGGLGSVGTAGGTPAASASHRSGSPSRQVRTGSSEERTATLASAAGGRSPAMPSPDRNSALGFEEDRDIAKFDEEANASDGTAEEADGLFDEDGGPGQRFPSFDENDPDIHAEMTPHVAMLVPAVLEVGGRGGVGFRAPGTQNGADVGGDDPGAREGGAGGSGEGAAGSDGADQGGDAAGSQAAEDDDDLLPLPANGGDGGGQQSIDGGQNGAANPSRTALVRFAAFCRDAKLSRRHRTTLLEMLHSDVPWKELPPSDYLLKMALASLTAETAGDDVENVVRLDTSGLGLPPGRELAMAYRRLLPICQQWLRLYENEMVFDAEPEMGEENGADVRKYGHPFSADCMAQLQEMLDRKYGAESGKPFAIIMYADKTTRPTMGETQSYFPIYLSLLNLLRKTFNKVDTKVVGGFIPVIKRTDECQAGTPAGDAFQEATARVEDECYRTFLYEAQELEKTAVLKRRNGEILRVCIVLAVGDHPQLQAMAGVTTAWNAKEPCRVCHVPFENTDQFYSWAAQRQPGNPCRPRKAEETWAAASEARELWTQNSRRAEREEVRSALSLEGLACPPRLSPFLQYPFAMEEGGIHAHSAQDFLHHIKHGICKMTVELIVNAVLEAHSGKPRRRTAALRTLNERLRSIPGYYIVDAARRLVNFGRNSNALLCSTLTGSEYAALAFQLCYALGELAEAGILPDPAHKRVQKVLRLLCKAYRATYEPESFSEQDLDLMERYWDDYIQAMKVAFEEEIKRPKVHMLSHLRQWITHFGHPTFYDTNIFELAHKSKVKAPSLLTNSTASADFSMLRRAVESDTLLLAVRQLEGHNDIDPVDLKHLNLAGATRQLTPRRKDAAKADDVSHAAQTAHLFADGGALLTLVKDGLHRLAQPGVKEDGTPDGLPRVVPESSIRVHKQLQRPVKHVVEAALVQWYEAAARRPQSAAQGWRRIHALLAARIRPHEPHAALRRDRDVP